MLKLKRVKQKTEDHAARERSNLFEMKFFGIDSYQHDEPFGCNFRKILLFLKRLTG